MPAATTILLIPLLPLAGFLLLGLFGNKIFRQAAGIAGTLLSLAAFALAAYTALSYFQVNTFPYPAETPFQFRWLFFRDELSIDIGLLIDPLSLMMILVVTFVSLMVHIFSLAYMKGEERFSTYYAFLSLFSFSMLGLVLSSNIFEIYIFWELVGLSSFLLIGFYYNRPGAVAAAKKAFIITRFADLGFLIGILILSFYAGTLDFKLLIAKLSTPDSPELIQALSAGFLGCSALTWGLVLIFIGGAGKSAMFPLHVWLPDAMEGPTPVSALIHAATMVVAGVFLVARLFPVFALSAPGAQDLVAATGIVSAMIAALIACTQTDIKRVLAYSTMSQIGFMMFALGVSGYGNEAALGYTAGLFHLFTHAMFKALLFLAAGVIIHFVHSNDMREMGGLRKPLAFTHVVFLIACLAIAGIPPFSGFFSKEEILLAAYQSNKFIFWLALLTSALTAFYMFRLYFNIFWNRPAGKTSHHHRSPFAMKLPLLLLVLAAAFAGFVPFGKFLSAGNRPAVTHFDISFSLAPVLLAIAAILLAAWLYRKQNNRPEKIAGFFGGLFSTVRRKFYIDELYEFVTRRIVFNLVGRSAAWFDRKVVDGMVNATGDATTDLSEGIKRMQSGKLQQYALYSLLGIIVLALLFIYWWK